MAPCSALPAALSGALATIATAAIPGVCVCVGAGRGSAGPKRDPGHIRSWPYHLHFAARAGYSYATTLAPKYTLSWNKNGDSFDFHAQYDGLNWCVACIRLRILARFSIFGCAPLLCVSCRIAVGISADGFMVGTPATNAVVCKPDGAGGGDVQQWILTKHTASGFVADATTGTSNLACFQSGGSTTMTWTRQANNGNPSDAQISMTNPTHVVFAVGGAQFTALIPSIMNGTNIDFKQPPPSATPSPFSSPGASPFASASPSAATFPGHSAEPTASGNGGVSPNPRPSPSVGASPNPAPSSGADTPTPSQFPSPTQQYVYDSLITPGLLLQWTVDVTQSTAVFRAGYVEGNWCVLL